MIWSYAVMVLAFLVVTVIGELLPFMKDLEAAINESRRVYVGSAIAVLVLGFAAFMGGGIYGAGRGVRSRGPRRPPAQSGSASCRHASMNCPRRSSRLSAHQSL